MKNLNFDYDWYFGIGLAIGFSTDGDFLLILPFIGIVIGKKK